MSFVTEVFLEIIGNALLHLRSSECLSIKTKKKAKDKSEASHKLEKASKSAGRKHEVSAKSKEEPLEPV